MRDGRGARERPQVVTVAFDPCLDRTNRTPDALIETPYVLLLPDGLRLRAGAQLGAMLRELVRGSWAALAGDVLLPDGAGERSVVQCIRARFDRQRWTLHRHSGPDADAPANGTAKACQLVEAEETPMRVAPLLARTAQLRRIEWYHRPTALNMALILAARGERLGLYVEPLFRVADERPLRDAHQREKFTHAHAQRLSATYKRMGIKRILVEQPVDQGGAPAATQWFGRCTASTPRCFGTVRDDVPEYLWVGRWTPPCCLEALRATGLYVLQRLDAAGVRYWLEGGSLLGAVRDGDIIPWDYDIDLGVFAEDVGKSGELRALAEAPAGSQLQFEEAGSVMPFVWERSRPGEGDFFRVQYSVVNHMHVDIFVFHETPDGIMTKSSWIATHRQDCEFPAHYLRPLERIPFIGYPGGALAPNNRRAFLELKFGPNSIEHPRYPGGLAVDGSRCALSNETLIYWPRRG